MTTWLIAIGAFLVGVFVGAAIWSVLSYLSVRASCLCGDVFLSGSVDERQAVSINACLTRACLSCSQQKRSRT